MCVPEQKIVDLSGGEERSLGGKWRWGRSETSP